MKTTLATSQDLKLLASRKDLLPLGINPTGLATRSDVLAVANEFRRQEHRLDELRTEIRQGLEILELRLTIRLGAVLAAGFAVTLIVMLAVIASLRTAGL